MIMKFFPTLFRGLPLARVAAVSTMLVVPTILRERGFRFFFYMADRFEPPHVHVQRDDCAAKLWLDPLEFSFAEGFRQHECNEILRITQDHLDGFLRAWYQTFGGLKP